MATRHEIINIDFRANAAKANPAMDSLREAAKNMNTEIEKTKEAIAQGIKTGVAQSELDKLGQTLNSQEKQLRSFENAMATLSKGVGTLSRAIDAFNNGSLSQMSAAFQKASYNAAENAKKALIPGSENYEKNMAELDALQQKNLENLAKYKLRTEQMLKSIAEGGKISSQDLKQEADGIQELMRLLPHMGHEWMEYNDILTRVNDAVRQQADAEKRLKGAIVDASDAREEMKKLTREGAETARQQHEQAEQEIATLQKEKEELKANRAEMEKQIAATRELVAEREKAVKKQEKSVKALEAQRDALARRKDEEHDPLNVSRQNADTLREAAQQQADNLELQRKKTKELGEEVDTLKGKLEGLAQQQTATPKPNTQLEQLTSEAETADRAIKQLEERLKELRSADRQPAPTAESAIGYTVGYGGRGGGSAAVQSALQERLSDAWLNEDETTIRAFMKAGGFTGVYDRDSKQRYAAVSKKDILERYTEYLANRWGGYITGDDDTYNFVSGGKLHDTDELEAITEKERQKFLEMSWSKQKAWVERVIKKQWGEIDAILHDGADDSTAYVGNGDSALAGLRKVMNTETWKKGVGEDGFSQAELDAEKKLVEETNALIHADDELLKTEHLLETAKKTKLEIDEKIAQAQQQGAEATKSQSQAIEEEIEQINREARAIEERRNQLDQEQAARKEAYEAEKKRLMENPSGLSATEQEMFAIEKEFDRIGSSFKRKKTDVRTESLQKIKDRFGIYSDMWGSGRRSFASGLEENELNAYKNRLYDKVKEGSIDTVTNELEKIKELIKEINQASKDSSIEGNPNLQLDSLKKLRAEYEKVLKAVGNLGERKEDNFFDWMNEESSEAYKNMEALKKMPDEVRQELGDLESKEDSLRERRRDARERLAEAKRQEKQATEEATAAQEKGNDTDAETLRLKGELKKKEEEYNQSKANETRMEQELAETKQKSKTADEEAAKAEEDYGKAVKKNEEDLKLEQKGLEEKNRLLGEGNTTLRDQQKQLDDNGKAQDENARKTADAEQKKAQAKELTVKRMEDMLALLKEENRTDIPANTEKWRENEREIIRLTAALDEIKKKQAELQREPVERLMTERMQNLGNLSNAALQETKKFWQAMYDGADRNDPKLATIEQHLQKIDTLERERANEQLKKDADLLKTEDLKTVSEQELQASIRAAKQLAQAMDPADEAYKQLVSDIIRAEQHVSEFGLAGETSTQKQAQQMQQMTDRISQLGTLSDAALQETKKFWEAQVAGTEKGNAKLTEYEANLKKVTEQERERQEKINAEKSQPIFSNNLGDFSEREIREGIEAAKKILSDYKTADTDVEWLSKKIVAAEEHLKKYGLEAERQAKKQADAIAEMRAQLDKGTSLTESALKAQHNYWQRLINDPKTASENLQEYEDNLKEVKRLQKEMVETNGKEALSFFQGGIDNASADEIKEQAKALKLWRDSLPRQDKADLLITIDEYLAKAGQVAKESAEEVMNLGQALSIAEKALSDKFSASAEEIKAAIKSIETIGIPESEASIEEYRKAGDPEKVKIYEQELKERKRLLRDLKIEQDNVGVSHERMDKILENPINADNLNELRAAVKRAKAELNNMDGALGDNRKEYDKMAASVKKAEQQLKVMEGQAKGTASAFEKAWSRLKTYVGLYVGAAVAMQKLTGTMGDLMELSDRMGEVRKTTGFTADEVGRLSANLKKMDVRTSLTELMEISASAGQLGLKTIEDVQGFTEAANKLMIALPEMGKEAATEMMRVAIATGEVDKIRKQLQEGTVEGSSATAVAMEKIASTIDRLRASSASTAPEITDFVKRVGAVGAQSGITIDQVAALGSTVSSLGMRVEMSATALSRMLPAIRNNAFEIAKSIGVTPETVRQLFDAGRGMEVILMILQRMKDANMDADSIEAMMGMGGMRDIMKDLNQQGARAGIVFAGLSQNVDELRKQLHTANEAYEENVAIQNEFDRMNETTAARWERLKNQVEEMFVSDPMQRALGGIIDALRWIIDLLTGEGGMTNVIQHIIIAIGVFKMKLGETVASGIAGLGKLGGGFKKLWQQIWSINGLWNLLATGAVFAAMEIVKALTRVGEVSKSMGEAEKQLTKQMLAADKLFRSLAKVREEEKRAAQAAKEQAEAEAKKTKETEKATDKTNKLSKETDKLGKSEKDAAEQAGKVEEGMKGVNKEGSKSVALIREINSKYGTYLGYMLSETASARQLADARELINKKLRETITLKQREAAMSDIEQNYGSKVRKGAASTDQLISQYFSGNDEAYARVSVAVNEAAQKYAKDQKKFNEEVTKIIKANRQYISASAKKDFQSAYAQSGRTASDDQLVSDIASNIGVRAESYRKSVDEYQKQVETSERVFEARTNVLRKDSREATVRTLNSVMADWKDLLGKYQKAEGEEKAKLAAEVYKQQRAYNNLYANNADYFEKNDKRKERFEQNVKNMQTYEKGLRSVAGEAIRSIDAMERAESKITNMDFTNGGEGANNPWGGNAPAESTDWKNMTAEQLVARRKQMKNFVNSIQTDTDVQSVLKEDAALKKAIEKGMSSDMRTVIEWYNTERLKIQDELHARHLTNTGDWMDPKKQKAAHKQFKAELDAYLEELDAYYTERKTEIEKARSDEEITEGEAWRRNLKNENEWYQRRAELMMLYGEKAGDVTKEEQDRIVKIIAERTGDSVEFVRAMIKKTIGFAKQIEKSGEKGAAMVHDWYAKLDLNTQRSFLKSQQAITKQVKFIEDTLAKERPYDGITKNLQDNLDKMGVLAARMRKVNDELTAKGEQPKYSDADVTAQSYKEMAFYLRQAEDAYRIDITTLLKRMADEGMEETAKEIAESDMLKQAVMGQLRKTYQEVHDAIKKEASQIKKDVELLWNDETLGPDGKSIKANFDKVIAQLGMQQDSVSRANSLIGAGSASDNVASRIAMKQLQVQMDMQRAQFNMFRTQANQRMAALKAEAKEHERLAELAKQQGDAAEAERETTAKITALRDADNVRRSLGLTLAEETKKEEELTAELLKQQEEIQARLYTSLREWADLLASSVQSLFEAEHAGDAEFYNERAKLDLTGKGGPGAGTYIVIDNEGTEDAKAHYEYLDERQALERQHEIEQENARAEAWRKVMDDINNKLSETITDQLNAMLQNASVDANTQALIQNTKAIYDSMNQATGDTGSTTGDTFKRNEQGFAVDNSGQVISPVQPVDVEQPAEQPKSYWPMSEEHKEQIKEWQTELWQNNTDTGIAAMQTMTDASVDMPSIVTNPYPQSQEQVEFISQTTADAANAQADAKIEASKRETDAILANQQAVRQSEQQNDQQMVKTNKASFAAMTAAANMYGIAYQAMSNDNLSTAQRVQMMIVQAAGQAAMTMLTVAMSADTAETAMHAPAWISKTLKDLGPIGGPVAVGVFTALIGGLMGLATSKITKAKSQISQATGASVGAGRLATGMLTYAEGNVNELTDPASLTPGRSYNVDGADGKTYRAKYTGKNPRTHITNGPEFHLVGEAGREAIIDAHTTRLMQMDDTGIWQAIQTLYNGGSISAVRRGRNVGRGVRAFKDGNLDDFEEIGSEMGGGDIGDTGMNIDVMVSMQETNSRLADLLEQALTNGIKAVNKWDGPDGIPNMYNKYQKEAQRHGEKYL